jgi:Uma2 family endonuclease
MFMMGRRSDMLEPKERPMATVLFDESEKLTIPTWVADLASFRQWAETDDFPEEGRICWLDGEVWADMSKEQIFSHVLLKSEIAAVLGRLVKAEKMGLFLGDGAMLVNVDVDFACVPDAVFVAAAGFRDRVRLIEGKDGGYVELEGSPDMVLEVVSTSSVHKDTVTLRRAYFEAGIREYWLADARKETLSFEILRHTARGYAATPKRGGWIKSAVFGKAFRLTQSAGPLGHPEYTLEFK